MSKVKRTSNTTTRRNHQMSSVVYNPDNSEPLQVHIFGQAHEERDQKELLDALDKKGCNFNYHINLQDLYDLQKDSARGRTAVVFVSSVLSESDIRAHKLDNPKITYYTYPFDLYIPKVKNLETAQQVVDLYNSSSKPQPKSASKKMSVRLASVHSIDRSYSSSKQITKMNTNHTYEQIKYYRQTDYGMGNSRLFDTTVSLIKDQITAKQFTDIRTVVLKTKTEEKGKKVLLVAPMDIAKQLVSTVHEKGKEKVFDIVLIGALTPHNYYLDKSVVLATNQPQQIYDFFTDNHVLSSNTEQLMYQTLIRHYSKSQAHIQHEGYAPNGNLYTPENNLYTPQKERQVSNVNEYYITSGSKISTDKKPVKKLKKNNPLTGSRAEEDDDKPIIIEIPSREEQQRTSLARNVNNLNNTNNNNTLNITNNTLNNNNNNRQYVQTMEQTTTIIQQQPSSHTRYLQEGALKKKLSTPTDFPEPTPVPVPASSPIIKNSNNNRTSYTQQQITITNNSNGDGQTIKNNYRHPSTIIHQTSQQYKGSNRQSIMNMENDSRGRYIAHPYEQKGDRVIVSHQIKNNKPDVYYQTSVQTIAESEAGRGGNRIVRKEEPGQKSNYYSGARVVRKEEITQPVIVKEQEVQQQSRYTSPYSRPAVTHSNASLTYSSSNPGSSQPFASNYQRAFVSNNNNNANTNSNNANTNSNNVNNSNYSNNNSNNQNRFASPSRVTYNTPRPVSVERRQTPLSEQLAMDGYQKVERNGVTVYVKKADQSHSKAYPSNYTNVTSTSPNRYLSSYSGNINGNNNYNNNNTNNNNNTLNYSSSNNYTGNTIRSYSPMSASRQLPQPVRSQIRQSQQQLQISGHSGSPRVVRYDSPRRDSTYDNNSNNNNIRTSYYTNTVTGPDRQVVDSNTYARNYRPVAGGQVSSSTYRPKGQDNVNGVTRYQSGGGVVRVERRQIIEQRVEASNPFSPRSQHMDSTIFMNSKASELCSDGSMLRRNNLRFGVKLKPQEVSEAMGSKIASNIFTVRDLNKKMAVNRKIAGTQLLSEEEQKYRHVDASLTPCHYLFQEQLKYFQKQMQPLFCKHDRIDSFRGIQELTEKTGQIHLDFGFAVITQQQASKVNSNYLPEDYYLIKLKHSQPYLQINQTSKTIVMDSLERLPLAQKIVLDKKLYQYVLFRGQYGGCQKMAKKFDNTEFIVEEIEVDFSEQYLECYFLQMPQLTRVYILCQKQELPHIEKCIQTYKRNNKHFQPSSLRVICICTNNYKNSSRGRGSHPYVSFIAEDNSMSYRDVIGQVHQQDKQRTLQVKSDLMFLHQSHQSLISDLQKTFPKRFQFVLYNNSLTQIDDQMFKSNSGEQYFLVLSEHFKGEKVPMSHYTKVFMLGRAKTMPSKVTRVLRKEQLVQLLKK